MRRATPLLLVLVVVVAGALRFTAIGFGRGVPQARPDELSRLLAWLLPWQGPALPWLLIQGGGYNMPVYLGASLWRAWQGAAAEAAIHASDPHGVLVALRVWSAVLSTATIPVVFAVARHLAGASAGLVAAALLGASTLAAREAHFAKADSAAAFAASLLLLALVRPWREAGRRALVIGAAAGLVVSTKSCVGFMPAVAIALAWSPERAGRGIDWRAIGLGIAGFAAVVVLLHPFLLTSPGALLATVGVLRGMYGGTPNYPGADIVAGPLRYYATVALWHGCGTLFAVLVPVALGWALWRGWATRLVVVGVLGYWASVSSSRLVVARFFLPAVPGLAVLIGALVATVAARLAGRSRPRAWALVAATGVLIAQPLANAVTFVRLLGRPDTRQLAAAWIDEHVPPGEAVVTYGAPTLWTDYGAPPLGGRRALVNLAPGRWRAEGVRHVVQHSYPLPYSSTTLPPSIPGLRRVAVFDPFDGPLDDPVLEPLDAFYLPLARFAGIARPGPRIDVFEYDAP